MDEWLSGRAAQVAREDLVMFINACFSCTGQHEFYDSAYGRRVSIDFLHDYIAGNYRLLYARTLAAGINHFNQTRIIFKLLSTGRRTSGDHRTEESALITAALHQLPPQRAWHLLEELRRERINNRRSRAVAHAYLLGRPDQCFDAVKYRAYMRAVAVHAHLPLTGELGPFLFRHWQQRAYQTSLFEQFRQAHYSAEAVYMLPFTVAEGLAASHHIPRALFLERIEGRMTVLEKLRLRRSVARVGGTEPRVDFGRMPLTRLALYLLSLPDREREEQREILHAAMERAARRALRAAPLRLGRVAAVLDRSYSSSGSREKHRRPLAVALAGHYLLQAAARHFRAFWTAPVEDPLLVEARGQSDLATPLLDALAWEPDLVVIISDGFDNDPPGGAAEVLRVYRTKLDPTHRTAIVHCNPVFNSETLAPQAISVHVPTVALRDAEDLPTVLGFARFADGSASLAELEEYLAVRAKHLLGDGQSLDEKDAENRELGAPVWNTADAKIDEDDI